MRRRRAVLAAVGGALAGSAGCLGNAGGSESVSVLVAGSLAALAEDTAADSVEAHGSLTVRRLLLDEQRDPDAVALADPPLFEGLVDHATVFATNELTVAYDEGSPAADAITEDWGTALTRDGVRVGRTDPEKDPLGYRTVMALRLARRRGLTSGGILERSRIFPETALLKQVTIGKLDAAFAYANMAVEQDLPTVDLPASIDFSDPARADEYSTVSLQLQDRTVTGAPIRYAAAGMTDGGRQWVDDLASNDGLLTDHGFTVPADYPRVESYGSTG